MPVLTCTYCGKQYVVSQSRYERAMSGKTRHPTCSLKCKGRIMSLLGDDSPTNKINLNGLGIIEMLNSQNDKLNK